MKFKFLRPCKRCFPLWKLSFSVASSPWFSTGRNAFSKFIWKNRSSILSEYKMRAPEKNGPCKRCFLLWKSPFSDASPPAVHFFLNTKWNLLKNICTLQTLFPTLKIAIFWRIAPNCSFLSEYKMKSTEKHLYPANAVSYFENRHFLTHRPPAVSMTPYHDFLKGAMHFP